MVPCSTDDLEVRGVVVRIAQWTAKIEYVGQPQYAMSQDSRWRKGGGNNRLNNR